MKTLKRAQQVQSKLTHIENWKKSGLKMSHYCKDAGIPISTFSAWTREGKPRRSSLFKHVEIRPSISPQASPSMIELVIDSRIKMHLSGLTDPAFIISIVKGLMICS